MKGRFITLEGCEGVGKSTQLRLLAEYLNREGVDTVFTREPGGTPLAERIRGILLDEALVVSSYAEAELFATARRDHIDNLILPSIEAGKLVVCDRYIDSSLAYQGVARGLGIERVYEINAYARDNCMPELTIFIDMDPAYSWRRQKGKEVMHDRMERESAAFHAACYRGYKEIAAREPERFALIVPERDKTATHLKIVEALKARGIV